MKRRYFIKKVGLTAGAASLSVVGAKLKTNDKKPMQVAGVQSDYWTLVYDAKESCYKKIRLKDFT